MYLLIYLILYTYNNIILASRTGFPEAVFGQGKTPSQIHSILDSMAENVNKIIDNDVLIEMLNKPGKNFIICCRLVNLCILTSNKYWTNQDKDFEISFSLY